MRLSIITINYNNASGLKTTLDSVANQQQNDIDVEHIVIDGGSTDNSVAIIKQYPHVAKWVSERDNGIYNAMNKGIITATGDYIQILNSGDYLASAHVLKRMYDALIKNEYPQMIYGNMLKTFDGKSVKKDKVINYSGGTDSFLYFYRGTINHNVAWIKHDLFEKFGTYDESMKICSDWKWYVDAVAIGGIKPVYVDIDVTIFDMNGISENGGKNLDIIKTERRNYLKNILPGSVLADYDNYAFPIEQYNRLKHYHLYKIFYLVERIIFKLEKHGLLK